MNKRGVLLIFLLALSASSYADISMTYPLETTVPSGSSINAGFVSPGQTFDIVFSDNSGFGFEWDKIALSRSSLPQNWEIISTQVTDTSLVTRIKVPVWAQANVYVLSFTLSNKDNPQEVEAVDVKIIVKKNLVDASFARKSNDKFYFVGGKVLYSATISNSSIAPEKVRITSTLPSTWSTDRVIEIKPGSVENIELEVQPQSSGFILFSFQVFAGTDDVIIESFSSEINVRPTLKGKLVGPLSGFPFFTFSLLPFQLFNSFIGALMQ